MTRVVFAMSLGELIAEPVDLVDGLRVVVCRRREVDSFPEPEVPVIQSNSVLEMTILDVVVGTWVTSRHICHLLSIHLQPSIGGERPLVLARSLPHYIYQTKYLHNGLEGFHR